MANNNLRVPILLVSNGADLLRAVEEELGYPKNDVFFKAYKSARRSFGKSLPHSHFKDGADLEYEL